MEDADPDHNGPDHGATGIPLRDVSVGRWEAEMGMAEITVRRGKLWGSMGVIRNSKLYCHVEEAVYMVEQGSLVLLRGEEDTPMSRQEVYDFLVVPSYGCSWDAYQIFCHLKRLGYIVGRHGTPWSTSRPKGRPPDRKEGEEPEEENLATPAKSVPANMIPKSGEVSADDHSSGQGSFRGPVLEVVETELSTDAVACKDIDENSLGHDKNEERDEELTLSKSDRLFVEEKAKGFPSLFSNLQLSEEYRYMCLDTTEEQGDVNFLFDVHHPNGRFKKTAPGFPAFSLCVVRGQEPPERSQMRELEAMIGGRALKFGTVDCGHVSIFSFTTCSLPTLP